MKIYKKLSKGNTFCAEAIVIFDFRGSSGDSMIL